MGWTCLCWSSPPTARYFLPDSHVKTLSDIASCCSRVFFFSNSTGHKWQYFGSRRLQGALCCRQLCPALCRWHPALCHLQTLTWATEKGFEVGWHSHMLDNGLILPVLQIMYPHGWARKKVVIHCSCCAAGKERGAPKGDALKYRGLKALRTGHSH